MDNTSDKVEVDDVVEITSKILTETLEEKKEKPQAKEKTTSAKVSLKEIDDRLMTIDDFLNDY